MPLSHDRNESVLAAVVRAYVDNAKPVGSEILARRLGLSSATIRNTFMDLEEKGYLTHPHTSAGRVPTELGYRLYVDRLMQARRLNLKEIQDIERKYEHQKREVETLVRHTARILSAMTNLMGVAVFPVMAASRLDHFTLVPVTSHKILVLIVLDGGIVREEIVRLDEPVQTRELSEIMRLLNRRFAGAALTSIRKDLLGGIERMKDFKLGVARAALAAIEHALSLDSDRIVVEGASHLMEQPEFRDVQRMERAVRLLEERNPLAEAMERHWGVPGVVVEIGHEMGLADLEGFSLVHIPYLLEGGTVGALGVLGPTRMSYEHAAALLEHLSENLSGFLDGDTHD